MGDMVKLLVQLGGNLLALDSHGRVPRQLACSSDHRSTADLLTQLARQRLMDSVHGDEGDRGL